MLKPVLLVCILLLTLVESSSKLRRNDIVEDYDPSEGYRRLRDIQAANGPVDRSLLKSTGSFRVLIILVQFPDHSNRNLPEKSHFETLCREEMVPYLQHQSYGQYQIIDCDVKDWEVTTKTEAEFAGGVSNLKPTNEAAEFFLPVLDKLQAKNAIDWNKYETDSDGQIDALLVYHSGFAAEQGTGSNCNVPINPPGNRIFSQGHRASNNAFWYGNNGGPQNARVSGFAIASAFDRVCEEIAEPATRGVMTHEWIHTFGSPDLYDVSTRSGGKLGGLGIYDLMSNPFGPKADGNGGSLSAYTKQNIGWVDPMTITHDGHYTIRSAARKPELYRIYLNVPDLTVCPFAPDLCPEYLLIENRGQLDYDQGMPGRGLLIYHVDESMQHQDRAGYPGQPGWPNNGNHYKVAIVPKDGKYQLEKEENNGDAEDYWVQGDELGPTDTFPNTHAYKGGKVVKTGIKISDISAPNYSMTFKVSGIAPAPATATTDAPTPAPTVAPTDSPTKAPTPPTTAAPTDTPTKAPTDTPTKSPTDTPTKAPTPMATPAPTPLPSQTIGHAVIELGPTEDGSDGEQGGSGGGFDDGSSGSGSDNKDDSDGNDSNNGSGGGNKDDKTDDELDDPEAGGPAFEKGEKEEKENEEAVRSNAGFQSLMLASLLPAVMYFW